MMLAFTVEFQGDADADLLVRTHRMTRDVSASSIDAVVLAGYVVLDRRRRRPAPAYPGARDRGTTSPDS